MTFSCDSTIAYQTPWQQGGHHARDVAIYALGIGHGHDPIDERGLDFLPKSRGPKKGAIITVDTTTRLVEDGPDQLFLRSYLLARRDGGCGGPPAPAMVRVETLCDIDPARVRRLKGVSLRQFIPAMPS